MKRYLWILLAAPAIVGAQTASGLVTPTLGYLFDSNARSLRAIEGVPGAAILGDALHLGSPDGELLFDSIAVSSNRRFALAARTGEANLTLIRLDGRSGSASGSKLPAGRSWFSPSGNTAAIATVEGVEIWTGLPDEPALQRTVKTAMAVDKAAVSDNGRELGVLSGEALWLMSEDPQTLANGVTDAVFLRGTQDLVALTGSGAVVYRKSDAGSAATLLRIDGGVAMAFSRDENSLAVLGAGSVTWVDRESLASVSIPVEGGAQLARAEGNSVFQMADAAGNLWILDGDSATPRLVSVPATGEGQAQ